MRLLFVNYEFPPFGGGAAYASLATARELVSLGHRVDFLTVGNGGKDADEIEGIRIYRVRAHRRGVHEVGLLGALSFVCRAASRLRKLARQNHYDLYHYYFGLPTGLLSQVPGLHRHAPYVVSLRGSDVPGYDVDLGSYHRLLWPITRRIWAGAYRVVANSQDLRRLALSSAPEVAIDVISNGATSSAGPAVAKPRDQCLRILTVSRLIPRKGLGTLITALAKSRDPTLSLDIVGEGPFGEKLRRLAAEQGVAERVRFHGFVDRAGLASLYAAADVFVLASTAESCSMALLEAMAANLPLIATRVGGTTELVRHGHNGLLVDADNADELSSALQKLAGDIALRRQFAAANHELVREQYSWRAVARRYEELFQAALNARPDARRERAATLPEPVLYKPRKDP